MQRLSPMDSTHLSMETATTPMHVVGVLLLDLAGTEGGYSFDKVRQMLADRIHLMGPFLRRLVQVPLDLDFPVWIDDPDFDLDHHVHRVAVPPPGDMRALGELVGDIASQRLDRSKPLWELWVVEGLGDDRVAVVTKMHHSAIDGASGADLMVNLFDLTPEVRVVDPPTDPFVGEQPPSELRLLGEALVKQALAPVKVARQIGRSAGNLVQTVGKVVRPPDGEKAVLPFTAPRTPFSGALTQHRSVAFGRVALDDLKLIKNAFGGKVNDVILAVTTQALRGWLLDHGGLPDKPLVASCPISTRKEGEEGTNQITAMLVPLPVELDDPADQLAAIIESTKRSKEFVNALGAETLQDWAEFTAPRLFNLAMQLYSRMRLGDYHRPMQNLIVSNVPGPPLPLYCAGARVEAIYPMGPLLPGAGLNITVLSNMGNVDFGVMACRETVPDLWDIADAFPDAVAALRKAAD